MRRWILALALATAGCDQMAHQDRYDGYGAAPLFADGKVLQAPPPGVVSQDAPARDAALATPPPMTLALLERGRDRYGIYCAPQKEATRKGTRT